VDLSGNELSALTADMIAVALEENKALTWMDLGYNNLAKQMRSISRALEVNSTLLTNYIVTPSRESLFLVNLHSNYSSNACCVCWR